MIAAISEWQVSNDSAERWYIQMDHLQNAMRSTRASQYMFEKKKGEKEEATLFQRIRVGIARWLLVFCILHHPFDLLASVKRALQRDATTACILAGSCRGHAATAPFYRWDFRYNFPHHLAVLLERLLELRMHRQTFLLQGYLKGQIRY